MAGKQKIRERDTQAPAKGRKVDPDNPLSPPKAMRRKPVAKALDQPSEVNAQSLTFGELPGNVRPGVAKDAAALERHNMRKGWFLAEAHRQATNRARMAKCESYYDSEQWTHDDAETLRERGQDPTVYNEIKPTIDWLIGTERRARVDFVVMAEEEGDDADDDAALKTKVLKYLDDTNTAAFERSRAAEDAFKAGIGWIEVGASKDPAGPPVFVGFESWRNVLWDSQAQRLDLRDGRYQFRIKVVDYDVALALFPDKQVELGRCVQTGDQLQVFSEWMGGAGAVLTGLDAFNQLGDVMDYYTSKPVDMFNARKRILLLECWSRDPVKRTKEDVALGRPLQWRINVAIMTEHDTLIEAPSPYKHDRFPFIPVWAYRNARTGLPYSPVWPLIGPQDSLNKRMSKALLQANSNQLEMEVGAVDADVMDLQELRDEYNDPNGVAVLANGALQNNKVRVREWAGDMQQQIVLAEVDRVAIRGVSGVSADNRGMNSNVTSGKAVLAKQDQGSLLTAQLFDNLLLARKQEGELTLSCVEQYMTEPRTIRVAEGIGKGERVNINEPTEDVDEDGQIIYRNDLAKRRASFVVGEQAWKQAYAEAAFESLLEVLSQLATAAPQAVINMLDLVFDMHPNLPKKRQIVQRIRAINGQTDPDAKLSPEEEAAKQQKEAIAQEQFELQLQMLRSQVAEARAKGEKLDAEAVSTRLAAIYEAAQAAQVLSTLPVIAPIADELLRSAGAKDFNTPQVIQQPQAQPILSGPAPTAAGAAPAAEAVPPAANPETIPQGAPV
jgi:hypothetical protein